MERALERLALVGAQDELILLRASLSAPRVLHLLRCSPSLDHPALSIFDDILKSAFIRITNSDLNDSQWLQATLPLRVGGMGLRSTTSLALPSFLASASASSFLQNAMLVDCFAPPDPILDLYLNRWMGAFGLPLRLSKLTNSRRGTAQGLMPRDVSSGIASPRQERRRYC